MWWDGGPSSRPDSDDKDFSQTPTPRRRAPRVACLGGLAVAGRRTPRTRHAWRAASRTTRRLPGGEERRLSTSTPRSSESSPSASASGFVKVANHRISYQCDNPPPSGAGGPTVVLLTGLDNDMAVWDGTRRLLGDTPTCAYDRANLGESDSVVGPRAAADSVTELHGFLEAAQIPPPYIMVGHSYGGLLSTLYHRASSRHPQPAPGGRTVADR